MGATAEAIANLFVEVEAIIRGYVAQQPEEHDLEGMLDALELIRLGDFNVDGNCLWDIWDAVGLVSDRTPMLDKFYLMLGMMKIIQEQ